jgi:UDP-glucose 4-epimerase
MKTILITGGAGFLGSHVAEHVMRNGHQVFVIDDLSGGVESNVPEGARFIKMDICDAPAINRLFSHIHFDAVVHCAAFASENLSHNCRAYTYKNIVLGSANITNAAVNYDVPLVASMSSIAVYGVGAPPYTESAIPAPIDPYGAAKACMESDLRAAHDMFGLGYAIFRPHNIIGTKQSLADSTRNVCSIFIRQVIEGKPMTVFGDGQQTRGFSPVADVANVIASCIDRPNTWNETYNIGGDEAMTVNELFAMVASAAIELGLNTPTIVHLPERHEVKHAISKHDKVKAAFPDLFQAYTDVYLCVKEMMMEALAKPMPEVKLLPPIEIQKKLNPAWIAK